MAANPATLPPPPGAARATAPALPPAAALALGQAEAVRSGRSRATDAVESCLARIGATEPHVNAFTAVLAERARKRAAWVDANPRRERMKLAGVPFAVKNLFDIASLPTLAGSKIEASAAPAARDALLVRRLEAEGAVLVGALNMDEYAYGFTTENSHAGATHNPHDPTRSAGGSSGGSAAAVAAGQVAFTLGSDTNGSIRVPSSCCGVFGLKPTFGRLPRTGSYPFVASLDHLGPFARSVADLALVYDLLQGADARDPGCVARPPEPVRGQIGRGTEGLVIGVLGGWFREMAQPEALAAVDAVAAAFGTTRLVEWPEVEAARAAAFLISAAEGAELHLPDLQRRPQDFDPLTRDRFLANALIPAAWAQHAQRVRARFAQRVARSFETVDLLIAPATPCCALPLGTTTLTLNGQTLPARPNLGVMSQPISCIGLPVATVPLWGCKAEAPHLPIGVQLIAAPWREDLCLRAAAALERLGLAQAPVADVSAAAAVTAAGAPA